MLDEPPSILPRGTGTRRSLSPSPALPGSAVYIQSVSGLRCMAAGATGIDDTSGGRSPASISATRQNGSSLRREAITAPADPPPTTTKSKSAGMSFPPPVYLCRSACAFRASRESRSPVPPEISGGDQVPAPTYDYLPLVCKVAQTGECEPAAIQPDQVTPNW